MCHRSKESLSTHYTTRKRVYEYIRWKCIHSHKRRWAGSICSCNMWLFGLAVFFFYITLFSISNFFFICRLLCFHVLLWLPSTPGWVAVCSAIAGGEGEFYPVLLMQSARNTTPFNGRRVSVPDLRSSSTIVSCCRSHRLQRCVTVVERERVKNRVTGQLPCVS